MHRLLFLIVFLIVLLPLPCIAKNNVVVTGTIFLKETIKKKTSENDVEFFIKGNKARINTKSKVYYIVDLDTDEAFLVNTKRNTVSKMHVSSMLNHSLPPLVTLKDKSKLKCYLTSTNAHFEGLITEGLNKFELWNFNIDAIYYKVKVSLPEYFPVEVEITSKKGKTIAVVEKKINISGADLPENYFDVPNDFDLLDLIEK